MEISKDKKTALIFGATGLVGGFCTDLLLQHKAYSKVLVLTRRSLKKKHEKLVEHIVDFDQLESYESLIKADDVFCCIGTTIRKAGSKDAFYKVDYTYAHKVAKLALDNGANQFLLISSVGADPDSLFFYTRVKGELEQAIKRLPYWSIHIFQPSVLLGERNENRWGEEIAARITKGLDNLLGGFLTKYRPVEAEVVAKAMVSASQKFKEGIFIYPSHYLQGLAEEEQKKLTN